MDYGKVLAVVEFMATHLDDDPKRFGGTIIAGSRGLATATVNEGQRALLSNLAAVRAVSGAIEGTLGPKGLDCLLVEDDGEVILTNDGVTILQHLAVDHPAARLLIQAARAQERAVGDGTTTATILAGALIGEGLNQIIRGVPVTRVVDGMQSRLAEAQAASGRPAAADCGLEDPVLALGGAGGGPGRCRPCGDGAGGGRHPRSGQAAAEGFLFAEVVLGWKAPPMRLSRRDRGA